MHSAAFAQLGLAAEYRAWGVPPEKLRAAVTALRAEHVLGANVTIPHKQAVVPLVDELSAEALAVGAVNTVINRGGVLVGHNTDASGFLHALTDLPLDPDGCDAVVLGAGGAARAVVYALLTAGARSVAVSNRTAGNARRLAAELAAHGRVRVLAPAELPAAVRGADLVVNSTSVGMAGVAEGESPLPAGVLPKRGAVVDLVYRPARTRLLADAAAAGLRVQNGLPMLVWQGAESFSCWTGLEAPADAMLRAAESQLA